MFGAVDLSVGDMDPVNQMLLQVLSRKVMPDAVKIQEMATASAVEYYEGCEGQYGVPWLYCVLRYTMPHGELHHSAYRRNIVPEGSCAWAYRAPEEDQVATQLIEVVVRL